MSPPRTRPAWPQATQIVTMFTPFPMDRFIKHDFNIPLTESTSVDACLTSERKARLETCIKGAVREIFSRTPPNPRVGPSDVYIGDAGIALMFERLRIDLELPKTSLECATAYVACALAKIEPSKHSSFLCTEVGVHCIAAVVLAKQGKVKESREYATQVIEVGRLLTRSKAPEMELLYGLSGYLYALLFLDKYLSYGLDGALVKSVVQRILEQGRSDAKEHGVKGLLWKWHDKAYLGAAHGSAGILVMLLRVAKFLTESEVQEVTQTIDYLITLKLDSGNYPTSLESHNDKLVQWCHGATGFVLLLLAAHRHLKDDKYLEAAKDAGELVWERGLLKKGVGLCHGISGNAYALLALHHATKNTAYFQRALAFAEYAMDWHSLTKAGTLSLPDRPLSLFEGLAGSVMLWNDLLTNQHAFPCMTDV